MKMYLEEDTHNHGLGTMKKDSAAAGAGEAAAASILGFHAVRRSKTVRAATNKFRQ